MISLSISQYLDVKARIDALQGAQSTLYHIKYHNQYHVMSTDTICMISFKDWDLETDFVKDFNVPGHRARMITQGGHL